MESLSLDVSLVRAAHTARTSGNVIYLVQLPLADWGIEKTYQSTAGLGDFVFRSLTLEEFDQFAQSTQLGDVTDLLIEETLVWPGRDTVVTVGEEEAHPIDFVAAGSYDELASLIVDLAGFENQDALYQAQGIGRAMSGNVFSAAEMFVRKAFPGMRSQDVRDLGIVELFRHVGMAEQLLIDQEGNPTEFPLRDMINPKRQHEEKGPKIDWDRLPVLSEAQVNELQVGGRERAIQEKIAQKRAYLADGEAQQQRSVAIRREKMAQIAEMRGRHEKMASEDASAELRANYGGSPFDA